MMKTSHKGQPVKVIPFLNFLLFISIASSPPVIAHDETSLGSEDYSLPTGLSLSQFNAILSTEASNEFGNAEEHWNAVTKHQWNIARNIEKQSKRRRDLRGHGRNMQNDNDTDGLSPFLVCHVGAEKSAIKNRIEVETFFQTSDLVQISNNNDGTCFFISTMPSLAQQAPSPFILHPMMPEMKIENVQVIENGYSTSSTYTVADTHSYGSVVFDADHLPASRFNALFSPGFTKSREDALHLANNIINDIRADFLNHRRHRSLVSSQYLRLQDDGSHGPHRPSERFERFLSAGIDHPSGLCDKMMEGLIVSASHNGDMMTVDLAIDTQSLRHDFSKECLHSFVAALAVRRELCIVDVSPEKLTMNSNAQWITQSGTENYRPFFDSGLTGEGQVVAVSDTGLDDDNCYFYDSSGPTPRTSVLESSYYSSKRKVVQYVSFVDGSDATYGHGTHVAGTIAGRASNGSEGSGTTEDGVARDAQLAFFDIGNSNQGLNIPSTTDALLDPGRLAGANIHSASWGSFFNAYGSEERALDAYMYEHEDFLFVVAAGNSGKGGFWTSGGTVGSPATAKNALAVGATESEGPDNRGGYGKEFLASFSSRGPTRDGRIKPEIMAPGSKIRSAAAAAGQADQCDTFPLAGTSMATPVVSGTAALVRQYFEEGYYPSGSRNTYNAFSPSSALVKATLINGASALSGAARNWWGPESVSVYDNNQGFGRINLLDSLPLSGKNSIGAMVKDRIQITDGQLDEYEFIISNSLTCGADGLSATLVWTDPPGGPGCIDSCLINDLDLTVEKGEGFSQEIYYANGRTNSPDTKNNVERVRVSTDDGDRLVVRVRGSNLSTTSQKYALIVTGCFGERAPPIDDGAPPMDDGEGNDPIDDGNDGGTDEDEGSDGNENNDDDEEEEEEEPWWCWFIRCD